MTQAVSGAAARCVECDAPFTCGALTPGEPCWCASLPPVKPPVAAGGSCLCPACLAAIVEQAGARAGS